MFTVGDRVGDIQCVNYSIINDNIFEGTEEFHVEVYTDDPFRLTIIPSSVLQVFIFDDDGKY